MSQLAQFASFCHVVANDRFGPGAELVSLLAFASS